MFFQEIERTIGLFSSAFQRQVDEKFNPLIELLLT